MRSRVAVSIVATLAAPPKQRLPRTQSQSSDPRLRPRPHQSESTLSTAHRDRSSLPFFARHASRDQLKPNFACLHTRTLALVLFAFRWPDDVVLPLAALRRLGYVALTRSWSRLRLLLLTADCV